MSSRKIVTLCLIRDGQRVLLGLKKRGFGVGKWNGFGGKVDPGETIEQAALREVKEECGLDVNNIEKFAVIVFEFIDGNHILEGHIFTTSDFRGKPVESDEMRPKWYPIDALPFDDMWLDDRIWFPYWLRGAKFVGYFKFQNNDVLLHHWIREVSSVEGLVVPC